MTMIMTTTTQDECRAAISAFLADHIRNHDVAAGEDIFAAGFVTSMFAMQLVLFLEGEFGVKLANQDLKLDNFRTIDRMVALIEHKTATYN
jgi:methoxymalonate biosynthesis acyl carrier protein